MPSNNSGRFSCLYFILVSFLASKTSFVLAWHKTIRFDSEYKLDKIDYTFQSEYKQRDYFALLANDRNNYVDLSNKDDTHVTIVIGARNNFYELRLPDLKLLNRETWKSSSIDSLKCLNRSVILNKDECDNYVKMFVKLNEKTFRVCSTNSLNPKCRVYVRNEESEHMESSMEMSGIGYSPLRAYENKYVYNYVQKNKLLYTANSIDLNRYFTSINRLSGQERISTNVDDTNWLYRAEFIQSFSDNERIYFLFNEEATPSQSNENGLTDKRYSRIGQICLNDLGAPLNSLRNIWTTFLKAKLSCVYDLTKVKDLENERSPFYSSFKQESSSTLFYFDEIKSISEVYTSATTNRTYFYGVFTTSLNSVTASAICRFDMQQIMSSFHGSYDKQKATQSSKSNVDQQVPRPRPSECPTKLTYQHLMFSRKNIAMQEEIIAEALVVETASSNRFRSIDVHFEVEATRKQDVIYVGSNDDKVLKFVFQNDALIYSERMSLSSSSEKILEDESNESAESILNINFLPNGHSNGKLIIFKSNQVLSVDAHLCHLRLTESKCNHSLYPYCTWSNHSKTCFSSNQNSSSPISRLGKLLTKSHHSSNRSLDGTNLTALSIDTEISELEKQTILSLNRNEISIKMNWILFLFVSGSFLTFAFLVGYLISTKSAMNLSDEMNSKSLNAKSICVSDFSSQIELKVKEKPESEKKASKINSLLLKWFNTSSGKIRTTDSPYCEKNSSKSFTISSQTENTNNHSTNDARYVSMNHHMNSNELNEHRKSRFLDYDHSEYFTLRTNNANCNKCEPVTTSSSIVNMIKSASSSSSSGSQSASNYSPASSSSTQQTIDSTNQLLQKSTSSHHQERLFKPVVLVKNCSQPNSQSVSNYENNSTINGSYVHSNSFSSSANSFSQMGTLSRLNKQQNVKKYYI